MYPKLLATLFLILFFINISLANDKEAITALIKRILSDKADEFQVGYIDSKNGKDIYEIESKGEKILLRGNNNISIATAFNHYLRHNAKSSVSWNVNQLELPSILPSVPKKITIESPYEHRFYLNYCTFSYTMAFWDWERWEKEIDWMALHGINLPLAIVGQEAVWQKTLKKYGYNDKEIKEFIPGPAYNAWWLMGNLEGWGGPVPQSWIDNQAELQKKIVQRMRELGMNPVLQGFYGMVPNSLANKFPGAQIHDPGSWLGFKRPAMLMPTDPLFSKIARTYYEEQAKLYGTSNYFQGDPFHEGGSAEGVNLSAAGQAIYQEMQNFNPEAVWVLQAWQDNPKAELLKDIPLGKAVITDLMSEARPQWGGRTKHLWDRKEGYLGHHWIWSEIPNFGGRTGMTAKLDSTNIDVIHALHHPIGQKSMKGIGATPEAIEQDAVIYDLIFDLAWTIKKVDMHDWLEMYTTSRYGAYSKIMLQVWEVLRQTVYNSAYGQKDPPIETILCARPGWNKTSASSWGEGQLDYDPDKLSYAWTLAMKAAPDFSHIDTYQYDMVNLTRQVLANYARSIYEKMQKAYEAKDVSRFTSLSNQFLELIEDQDRLLSTRKEFMLGRWLEMAKGKGKTSEEKKLYEWNARILITMWTHELNDVNDYSGREWAGLLKDFYLIRWQMFIDHALKELKGEMPTTIEYFPFEKEWVYKRKVYPTIPTGKAIPIVKDLYKKYSVVIN